MEKPVLQKQAMRIFLILLCGTLGCQNNKSILPKSVAGIWQAEGHPWQIVLEPDGTISSAVIAMGQNRIRPNETIRIEMFDDQISTYEAGDFEVDYNPITRKLAVTIALEHIDVKIGKDTLEGNSEDVFIGTVSKNGMTWEATLTQFYDYGERLPMPDEVSGQPITFHKILITDKTN